MGFVGITDKDGVVHTIHTSQLPVLNPPGTLTYACGGCDELRAQVAAQQAKIDALMLEYCPDDMTPEQMVEWGKRQRRVSPEQEAKINAALGKKS